MEQWESFSYFFIRFNWDLYFSMKMNIVYCSWTMYNGEDIISDDDDDDDYLFCQVLWHLKNPVNLQGYCLFSSLVEYTIF